MPRRDVRGGRGLPRRSPRAAPGTSIGFLFVFVVNPIDYCLTSWRPSIISTSPSSTSAWLPRILAAILGFLGFSLALRPVRDERRMERALAVLAAEALAAAAASGGLLGPSLDQRRDAVRACLLAHAAGAALAALHAMLTRRSALDLPMALDEVNTLPAFRAHFEDGLGRPSLERLERFLEVRSVRSSIRAQLRRSNARLYGLGGALLLLSLCNFALELRRTRWPRTAAARASGARCPERAARRRPSVLWRPAPPPPRGASRVVLLVVSPAPRSRSRPRAGRAAAARRRVQRDALSLALRAGPPSTSMSQWLALATGASAALHRRLRRPPPRQSRRSTLFRQARLHGLSSFATGSPWFTGSPFQRSCCARAASSPRAPSRRPMTYGTWAGWPQPPTYQPTGGDGFVASDDADAQRPHRPPPTARSSCRCAYRRRAAAQRRARARRLRAAGGRPDGARRHLGRRRAATRVLKRRRLRACGASRLPRRARLTTAAPRPRRRASDARAAAAAAADPGAPPSTPPLRAARRPALEADVRRTARAPPVAFDPRARTWARSAARRRASRTSCASSTRRRRSSSSPTTAPSDRGGSRARRAARGRRAAHRLPRRLAARRRARPTCRPTRRSACPARTAGAPSTSRRRSRPPRPAAAARPLPPPPLLPLANRRRSPPPPRRLRPAPAPRGGAREKARRVAAKGERELLRAEPPAELEALAAATRDLRGSTLTCCARQPQRRGDGDVAHRRRQRSPSSPCSSA